MVRVETVCLLRALKFDNIITCVGTADREWSLVKQLTDHGLKVLFNTNLFYLSYQETMNNGLVAMSDINLRCECEIHL